MCWLCTEANKKNEFYAEKRVSEFYPLPRSSMSSRLKEFFMQIVNSQCLRGISLHLEWEWKMIDGTFSTLKRYSHARVDNFSDVDQSEHVKCEENYRSSCHHANKHTELPADMMINMAMNEMLTKPTEL